jgi:hypothetical protein
MGWDGVDWDRIRSVAGVLQSMGAEDHDAPVTRLPMLLAGYASAVAPTSVSADGDVCRVWVDRNGRLQIGDGGGSITVDGTIAVSGSVTVAQATASSLNAEVQGDAAHGANVSGNPVLLGLEARTNNATAVSNGQAVRAMADDMGRQIVVANGVRDLVTQNNITLLNTTSETTLLTGVASTFLDVTRLILSNTSSTAVRVDVRDTTGGTVRLSLMLAANGGGAVIPFDPPLKQTTTGGNWTAQASASVADVRVFAQAVQNV